MGQLWNPNLHSFVPGFSGQGGPPTVLSGAQTYSVTPNDVLLVVTPGSAITILLPAATGSGRFIYIYVRFNAQFGGNLVQVNAAGTDLINETAGQLVLKRQGMMYCFIDTIPRGWALYPSIGQFQAPTFTPLAAAGTGATVVPFNESDDFHGRVTLTTGTASVAAGDQFTVTLAGDYPSGSHVPYPIAVPGNIAVAALQMASPIVSATQWKVTFGVAPAISTQYLIGYSVFSPF